MDRTEGTQNRGRMTGDAAGPAEGGGAGSGRGKAGMSFKQARRVRKKIRARRDPDRALTPGRLSAHAGPPAVSAIGPTAETAAKLTPDPLLRFQKQNILNEPQIQAFQAIRRALGIITRGTQVRISHINDMVVQTSRFGDRPETDRDIRLAARYAQWVDRMTAARLQVGPVLDIILDEMSLNGVDRKWGRRRGWAKSHLQASLDLYGSFPAPKNRVK